MPMVESSVDLAKGIRMLYFIFPTMVFIVCLCMTVSFLRFIAEKAWQYYRDQRTIERSRTVKVAEKYIHPYVGLFGKENDFKALEEKKPLTTYYMIFITDEGQRLEFQVKPRIYTTYVVGEVGELRFRGSRFLRFESDRY